MNGKVVVGQAQKHAVALAILSIVASVPFLAVAVILLAVDQFVLAVGVFALGALIFRFVWRKIKAG